MQYNIYSCAEILNVVILCIFLFSTFFGISYKKWLPVNKLIHSIQYYPSYVCVQSSVNSGLNLKSSCRDFYFFGKMFLANKKYPDKFLLFDHGCFSRLG